MSPLQLTATAQEADAPATFDLEAWLRIPESHRLEVLFMEEAFTKIRPPVRTAIAELSRSWRGVKGASAPRLLVKYYQWKTFGREALINHAKCKGCGIGACAGGRAKALPAPLIEEFRRRCGEVNVPGRVMSVAWRGLLRDLASGQTIPGIGPSGIPGTWRDLWKRHRAHQAFPTSCPWGEDYPPPGWSYKSFQRGQAPAIDLALAQGGIGAAAKWLYRVDMSTAHLRPLEYVVFDDKRLDILCWVGGQLCEVWCLFAMDVSTRMILGYIVRFRSVRADGTKESLSRRDMQHLIAGILRNHGYPLAHPMTLVVENAAAAVTTNLENHLKIATDGQVLVQRTSIIRGNVFSHGFKESHGQPTGKSWLESFYGLLDIETGHWPGQTGANYWLKPASLDDKKRHALALAKAGDILPVELAARLQIHFPAPETLIPALDDLILRLNQRHNHELKGFAQIREFRWSEQDPEWRSVMEPSFAGLPPVAQNSIFRSCGRLRPESPAERWQRTRDPRRYARVSEALFSILYMDTMPFTYEGKDWIQIDQAGRKFRAFGKDHTLTLRESYRAVFDLDHPEWGVCFLDNEGRFRGHMPPDLVARYGDVESTNAALQRGRGELKAAIERTRTRHHNPARIQGELEAIEEAITHFQSPPITIEEASLPGDPGAGDLRIAMANAAKQKSTPAQSVDDYITTAKRAAAARQPTPQPEPDYDF